MARAARRPAAGGRRPPAWAKRGVASNIVVRGQRLGVRVNRPGVDIARETGVNVRTRTIKAKKKTVHI